MLYFAYGSNLDFSKMRDRCPSAICVCVAKLEKHRLAFTHECRDRHGVADIVPDNNHEVWGAVYRIDDLDVGKLDMAEGYCPGRQKNSYERRETRVYRNGDRKEPLTISTYTVVKKASQEIKTCSDYKDHILNGARFWRLPPEYISALKTIPAID